MSARSSRAATDRPARLGLAEDARIAALIGFTLAAIAVVLANTNLAPGDNGGPGPLTAGIVISGLTALTVAIIVFSKTRHPQRSGLVLGALGMVTVLAFWSGLPFVLGSLGIALARRGNGRLGSVAQVVGALAVLGGVAAVVLDRL